MADLPCEHDAWALSILNSRTAEPTGEIDEGYDTAAVMALAAKHGGRCWYCGCELTAPVGAGTMPTTATRDHIVPRSKGGSNRAENIVAACRGCNNAKRTMSVEQYRTKLQTAAGGAPVAFYGETTT